MVDEDISWGYVMRLFDVLYLGKPTGYPKILAKSRRSHPSKGKVVAKPTNHSNLMSPQELHEKFNFTLFTVVLDGNNETTLAKPVCLRPGSCWIHRFAQCH